MKQPYIYPTKTNGNQRNERWRKANGAATAGDPFLLASPLTEEACRRAMINKTTVYEWLKDDTFRQELERQRDAVIERALDSLKANIAKATETLVKHLDSNRENISIRAAESIIEFTQKALVSGSGAPTLVLALAAQGSPLTVQPSTSRVGTNNANPSYTLDIAGTVNATGRSGTRSCSALDTPSLTSTVRVQP